MQRVYSAIDLRGYPSDLYERVCQVFSAEELPHPRRGLTGVEVETPAQLKKQVKADLLFARGGTVEKNRAFLTASAGIDILSRPYPFDSVQARLAAERGIAVELCFKEVVTTSGYTRARVVDRFTKTVRLTRKYHTPMVITSGARSPEEVVTPRQLVAFGLVLGLTYGEAKACIYTIPKQVIERGG